MVDRSRQQIAVLTGDLIDSSRFEDTTLDRAFARLSTAVDEMSRWFEPGWISSLQRFRGDGWQLAMNRAAYALRVALMIRAALKAGDEVIGVRRQPGHLHLDTRIFIGIGQGPAAEQNPLHAVMGEAFQTSGRGLDQLSTACRMDGNALPLTAIQQDMISALLRLCDVAVRDWTPRRAILMQQVLRPDPPRQKTIARCVGVTPQTINRHIRGAHGPALLAACRAFVSVITENQRNAAA